MPKALTLALALASLTSPLPAYAKNDLSAVYPRFMNFGSEQDAPRGFTAMCLTDHTLCDNKGYVKDAATVTAPAVSAPVQAVSSPAASVPALLSATVATPAADNAAVVQPVTAETATPSVTPAAFAPPALDLKQLKSINRRVNSHVRQISDERAFGVGEIWRASGSGPGAVGDCEDLALQKMVELRAAGYPPSSLLLAVAYHRRMGLHTVLVVRTEAGDYVLDNMSWSVKPWAKVKYSWLRVQSPNDPNRWYGLA